MMEEAEQHEVVAATTEVKEEETPPTEVNSNCNHTDNNSTSSPAEVTSEISLENEESEEPPDTADTPDTPDTPVTPQKPGSEPVIIPGNKNAASEKLQRVRKWSINTYKCTRQALSEKLGRGSRTVDLDLERRLDVLRDDRLRYENVTKVSQTLANQLAQISVTQKTLGDAFSELSVKTPALYVEFGLNAEAHKFLAKNSETLTASINAFTSDMNTLVNKTIEDTMINAKKYEAARIEYDAYRVDLEELNMGPRDANTVPKLEAAQKDFQGQKEKFQKIRDDLTVKVKLLEENKVKVLHNQLLLLHSAVAAHSFSCHSFLEQNLRQASEHLDRSGTGAPSFLEDS